MTIPLQRPDLNSADKCRNESDRQHRLSLEAFNRADFKKSAAHADEAIQLRRWATKLDRDEAKAPSL